MNILLKTSKRKTKVTHIDMNPWTQVAVGWTDVSNGIKLEVLVSWKNDPKFNNCRTSTKMDNWIFLVNGQATETIIGGHCSVTLIPKPEIVTIAFEGRHILARN